MAFPGGKKSYAELDHFERWAWHTDVYVFRHLQLDQPIAPGSPVDPLEDDPLKPGTKRAKYFDEAAIRAKLAKKRPPPLPLLSDDDRRKGVAMLNTFAATKGFASWDAAYEAGVTYADAIQWVRSGRNPTGSARNFDYFQPSKDELAAARAALGLTATETPQPDPEQPNQEAAAND